MTSEERIDALIASYRDGLLDDTLPFWIDHGVDREYGGFLVCLDRNGSILDTDKGMWQQCRFAWLLSTLYNTVEPREEWLALAAHGIDFIRRFGFDEDGRMFFQVTRDGRPLRKRRYVFTETFAAAALAAYSRAAEDEKARREAVALLEQVRRHLETPGLIPPKIDPRNRPMKGFAGPMALIAAARSVREADENPLYDQWIDEAIGEIEGDFMKPDLEAVMEAVGPGGEVLDHCDGRMLNPGHAIEAAWFILDEARRRGGDGRLISMGLNILDWMWKRGWDETYGGLFYFRDVKGLPVQEYWQDMKFWWPHCEAVIATLLAWRLTGDAKYAAWHERVHDWSHRHFKDPEHPEWFGYLHRDGTVSNPAKGNLWKGPFHLPRMQWFCWRLLEEMKTGRDR